MGNLGCGFGWFGGGTCHPGLDPGSMQATLDSRRAELVEACASLSGCRSSSKPGLAPAGDLLFFASPKKPKEKKGDPAVCVPLR
jgi:hypothetical protein